MSFLFVKNNWNSVPADFGVVSASHNDVDVLESGGCGIESTVENRCSCIASMSSLPLHFTFRFIKLCFKKE